MTVSQSEKTAGQQSRAAITHPYEREAAVLLFLSGWTVGELAMTMQVGKASIRRLLVAETDASDLDDLREQVTEEYQ